MKIYVASSWRNTIQPEVVKILRAHEHEVYDFREPAPGVGGFSWSEIDQEWERWSPEAYREGLQHPIAKRGYKYDINALKACEACVLVLPSGRSASWEFGYAMGEGKKGYVLMIDKAEPELMYREAQILTSWEELNNVALVERERERRLPCQSTESGGWRCEKHLNHLGAHFISEETRRRAATSLRTCGYCDGSGYAGIGRGDGPYGDAPCQACDGSGKVEVAEAGGAS